MGTPALAGHVGRALRMDSGGVGWCMQPVLGPTFPLGCCVWPWDSWTGPQTLLMMGMILGSRVRPVLHVGGHIALGSQR